MGPKEPRERRHVALDQGVNLLKIPGRQTQKPKSATGRQVQHPVVPRGIAPRHDAVDGQGDLPTREGKGNDEALADAGHRLKGYVYAGGAQVAGLGISAPPDSLEMAGLRKWDPGKPGGRLTDRG